MKPKCDYCKKEDAVKTCWIDKKETRVCRKCDEELYDFA